MLNFPRVHAVTMTTRRAPGTLSRVLPAYPGTGGYRSRSITLPTPCTPLGIVSMETGQVVKHAVFWAACEALVTEIQDVLI